MEDDCDNFELSLTANKMMFDKTFKEFMRIKPTTNENKIKMTKDIKLIDQLIPETYKTFDKFIKAMKNCNRNHTQKIKETENDRKNFKEMDEKYTNYLKKLYKEGFEPIYDNKKQEKKIIKKQINPYEDINENKNFILQEEEEEILAKIQVGNLLKDDPNLISGIPKEKRKEIIELKNSIQKSLNEIGEYLKQADVDLIKIENKIEETVDNMIEGNNYLEKAANYAVERRALKLKTILGIFVSGICIAIPGASLIGGAIVFGGEYVISNFIEKLEKKYLQKIKNM